MARFPDERPPMAMAMEWVARITAVGLEMFLPGLAGQWLDAKLGTRFLTLAGFAIGLIGGTFHLLVMTGAVFKHSKRPQPGSTNKATGNDEPDHQ